MIQLHDKTRRKVCIAGFFAFGLLPTLLVGYWCADRHLPGCARSEAERLGRQLGLAVKLKSMSNLRPGVVLYREIEFADPETGQAILHCPLLEIACRQRTDDDGKSRTVFDVVATQPEVEAVSLGRSWQWLLNLLEGKPDLWENDLRFSADQVTLRADHSQTLSNVDGLVETLPAGTRAEINFRLAGADTPEPARIRVVRNRQTRRAPAASSYTRATANCPATCWRWA